MQTMTKPKMTLKQRRILREIRQLQETQKSLLPRATFRRLVDEVTKDVTGKGYRFNAKSILALQTAVEDELTTVFEGANTMAKHDGRDTVTVKDVKAFQIVRNM